MARVLMLTAARVTLKHHRFEIVAVTMVALLLAAAGQWFNSTLLGFNVPPECFEAWMNSGGEPAKDCSLVVEAYAQFLYGNMSWFDPAMAILPFAAGTLIGVPLVARELESRTAQTAWALSPSRTQWLLYQLWPVLLVVGVAVTLAALSAAILHHTRLNGFPPISFQGQGFQGPLVIARALSAFGVALLAGAFIGRSLPALIVSVVVSAFVLFIAMNARQAWINSHPGQLVDADTSRGALLLESYWQAPDGTLVADDEVFALLPDNIEDSYEWLLQNGYRSVARAISPEVAAQWEPIESAGTVAFGAALIALTFPVVSRRRPT